MEQGVHQRETMGVGHEFHADEGFVLLERLVVGGEIEEVVGLRLDMAIGDDE